METEGQRPKGARRFKVVKKVKDTAPSVSSDQGAVRPSGTSQSIYATSSTLGSDHSPRIEGTVNAASSNTLGPDQNGWFGASSSSGSSSRTRASNDSANPQADSLGVATGPVRQLRKSRSGLSLSERLGMDDIKEASNVEPMPNVAPIEAPKKTGGKKSRPPNLEWANTAQTPPTPPLGSLSSPIAQTPLSASHPLPETPLKHIGRKPNKRVDLPLTPGIEQAVYDARGSNRVGGLLLEAGGDSPVFPKELQTPKRDALALGPMTSPTRSTNGSQSQIDAMLAKLKLARTGAGPPQAGTQQSRWAVKESQTSGEAKEDLSVETAPVVENRAVGEKSAIPTAPRALREKSAVRNSSPPAGKSLLERMSAPAMEEAPAPIKSKKDRKRGGKKAETRHEPLIAASKVDEQFVATSQKSDHEPAIVPRQPDVGLPASPTKGDDAAASSLPESEAIDQVHPSDLPPSTSSASVATDHTAEGSNIGNDTWGTINWADDDDDLPELPEEWMRAAKQANQDDISVVVASPDPGSTPVMESSEGNQFNGNAQRGARRGGGRGRGARRDRQITPIASSTRGIMIAGSAAQASKETKQTPKELFPMHKQDNAPRNANAPPPNREQRHHGRPKLAPSNKETFSRLTKGALGPAPAAGSAQVPARKQ
jgi:hypothetical protein